VTSARQALEMIAPGQEFDLIFCALMMPEMTGMDFHAELARLKPELAEKLIFLTGGAFTARGQKFLADMPNARVEKPFKLATLRQVIKKHLG